MNVISRRTIVAAKARHPLCAAWLDRWWQVAKAARWTCLEDVRQVYPSADQVGERLIFDATGGRRHVVGVSYAGDRGSGALFVKSFLTHAEYDKQNWNR